MEIKQVTYDHEDFYHLCKKLDDAHIEIIAEQRYPNANCCIGNEKYTTIYIMYDHDQPIGSVALTDVKNGIIYIGRVFVDPKYRCQGIATKLLKTAELTAKQKGATQLHLDTYQRFHEAVCLYKKLGFEIVPQFEDIINSPYSLCMSKSL